MALIVSGIRLPPDADPGEALQAAAKRLHMFPGNVLRSYPVKVSVDARHKSNISLVYSVGVELSGDEQAVLLRLNDPLISLRRHTQLAFTPGKEDLRSRPVIVGFGPAGMFAGLFLARLHYRPLIVERGLDVDARMSAVARFWNGEALNPECNVQFGEGGAGTFSDGKLVTRINDPRCETVLQEFVRFGAPQEILWLAKPHIGTDRLTGIVKAMRKEILANGGEVRFGTKLRSLASRGGAVEAGFSDGSSVNTRALVLALGHSARDTFSMLAEAGMTFEQKPFSVGVRIEHLQQQIDRGLYGGFAGHPALPPGEYQLSLRRGNRAVYTFCMCPGGSVVAAASEEGGVVVNGMSRYSRSGKNANSALAVSVSAEDFGGRWQDGVEFQRRLEQAAFYAGGRNYRAPFETVGELTGTSLHAEAGRVEPTYPNGVTHADLSAVLPPQITDMLKTGLRAFEQKLPGFGAKDALLTGVETRTSSPVRISRGDDFQAVGMPGVYPAGEGAGYAGGIMSAAVDGLRVAGQIIGRYRTPESSPGLSP